ncbi:hypothetical protein J2S43_001983 [Catenuloplanes nepalensis]|uniref:Uncharacterized protein n=1 Tax=Catenuloplanes nepalensis TaxID=587533 RepID=A0ABT9MQ94_9ACTN|nr:hypothetical protein [Catenuloplanes nepalensis]MDP9793471.1 hypothetical protein [Catenuloplanes nepalensis]
MVFVGRVRMVTGLLACVAGLAGCAALPEEVQVRQRCDGANMVYEVWDRDPGDSEEPETEFEQVEVVPGDPRCPGAPDATLPPATETIPPATATQSPAPRP